MYRKCNKVDYRVYLWGLKRMAEVKNLQGELGKVSDITSLTDNLVKEVVAWAGKLSTQ